MKYLLLSLLFFTGCATTQKNDYITVDQMSCKNVTKMYSKRQLSELTEMEKFSVKYSKECGVTFQDVRLLKSRIRAYTPYFSVELWRTDDKYKDDPGAPVHITKYNVEYCNVAFGGSTDKASWVVLGITCKELDEKLK